ncbi:MAG: hypothetical protein WCV50_05985 [Patescibacteria group bacterium]|jgi:hypothetical protein
MSLDNIINFLSNGLYSSDKKEEGVEFNINKKFIKNDSSSTLKIILPPWGDKESIISRILIRRLNKKGYSCLAYFFPRHILSSDVDKTVEFFNTIKERVKSDIKKLKAEYNFQKIDIIAPSLGVVSACLIANGNQDISNLYFIVPGSCLAASLWNGIRTQHLKNIYEKQGINQEKLINIWGSLAPKNNINALAGKNIFIAISRSDKIIPYRFGKELADLMTKLYPQTTVVQENGHLGHYLTVIKYYLSGKELLE